jgi:quinoprotein glucose dehydrogenase
MIFSMHRIVVLSLLLLGATGAALFHLSAAEDKPYEPHIDGPSDAGEKAISGIRVPKELKVSLWAAEPMLANPVCFAFDNRGRMYVAETFRLHAGVTDIRGHMNWLDDDLACRTVADRVKLLEKWEGDKVKNYAVEHDRIRLLEDTKGEGKADKSTVFADGFNHVADGIGAGLLARDGKVWYTCIPDLWLLEDTKGTGKADVRKSLHTGFGVHIGYLGHDLHGLRMGPDGKLYFSLGDRGANVKLDKGGIFNPDSGAVFRCNPDGSDLELFCNGLRNPQELAFDKYGNLFTMDNNSDSGDKVRWTYLVEGGDCGWRIGYQFDTAVGIRGPFNAEKIWDPPHDGQPAYIVPPIANLGDGPSGLTYYPGLGLPERYQDHFFLADFRGGSGAQSGVRSFANKPKGAGFEMVDAHEFIWGVLATDVDFGPDCAVYVSDWVNGWGKPNKGRIYKVAYTEAEKDKDVQGVKKLLAEGFKRRLNNELAALLEHKDQRVRQEAQFELATRAKEEIRADVIRDRYPSRDKAAFATLERVLEESKSRLARIHALWAVGQFGRVERPGYQVVARLTEDPDAEVRAQALRVLGDGRVTDAAPKFLKALGDPEPRVRFFAALGLARVGTDKEALKTVTAMLRANDDKDPWLRHAGVMALAHCDDKAALVAAGEDPSAAVRMGVLLALRRTGDPRVAKFLNDAEPKIVAEAARAINDEPIEAAFPQLAALSAKTNLPTTLLFRVVNANFRLGKPENAKAVASLAARREVPDAIRIDALKALQEWAKPKGRDRVMGLWRPLEPREENIAAEALRPVILDAFTGADAVRQEAARAAVALNLKEVGPKLFDMVADAKRPPQLRADMLSALAALKDSQLDKATALALADPEPRLRAEGRRVLAKTSPKEGLAQLAKALETGDAVEQQVAYRTLAEMKSGDAAAVISKSLTNLLDGKLPPETHLDLLEAAAKFRQSEIKDKLAKYEAARSKMDHLANYRESLVGGDAENGRRIFLYKAEVSCLRCHKVRGEGGEVGPDLTGIGSKQKRDYLLESIVDPNKQIAKGYESVILTLTSGRTVSGIVKAEDAKEVKLMNADGQTIVVPKSQIDDRKTGKSAMPEDVVKHLSKSELRDLVEFLAGLKEGK